MTTLVLTVIGDDRPGLVSALSAPITAAGGSWERSQMARLGGKFAGILLVTVAADRADALAAELTALGDEHGLQVVLEGAGAAEQPEEPEEPQEQGAPVRFGLELLGDDRPGIVAEISAALAEHGVSIEELTTGVRDAPMAGGTMFEARATLAAPGDVDTDALRSRLEELGDELMVEISLG
ncbi:ACT domain-containing protein [Nocardioides flavescens]|uniref:ACT domain-containing protein n=1 Tax=Nocardioides flavescens TaxID=2691959 RepID=A0A6L7F2D9_9ACTN|nr:ACT domain-containing protein [Nocardioides flavescens]